MAFDPQLNNISADGVFSISDEQQYWNKQGRSERIISNRNVNFDASRVVPTSTDNHPYSIYALPLISYERKGIDAVWAILGSNIDDTRSIEGEYTAITS